MIRLYIADIQSLSQADMFQKYYEKIDKMRQEKVDHCKNEADKKRSLLAGYLIQVGVKNEIIKESGLQIDATPLSLAYIYNENGKPYLKDYPEIYFNISHSGDYVVCGISDEEVGVDIQEHRKVKTDIGERFFSKEDNCLLTGNNNPLFYKIWTVKEAYMKLTGLGMKQGMNDTVVQFHKQDCSVNQYKKGNIICKNKENKGANFVICDRIEEYSMALCSFSEEIEVSIDKITLV